MSSKIMQRFTRHFGLAFTLLACLQLAVAQTAARDSLPEKKDQLAADSARLLQLATELKAEVDKSTKDQLSLAVIKKADEVEKLARKVREEMKLTPVSEPR